jgi:hypothetical protein
MTIAREIMSGGVTCVGEHESAALVSSRAPPGRHRHRSRHGRAPPEHAVVQFVKAICSPAAITS